MPTPRCVKLLNPACDDPTFHAKSQSTLNNWLSPTSPKDFQTYKNWHLKNSLWEEEMGWGAWTSLPSPKKGCLFGKSRTSDFVRHIPRNTSLTKALNYYLEINFCTQCIYQRQSWMCHTCCLSYLVFQLHETVSVKVLGGALTGKLNLMSGYTLNPLDVNHWPSLGLAVDPAAQRLLSEREFRKQGGLFWTLWLNGRALL